MDIKLLGDELEICINKVTNAITDLETAAQEIDDTMGMLGDYWSGAAYDYTIDAYERDYKAFLKQTVPENVTSLRDYIKKCSDTIRDVDAQLGGN